MTTIRQNAKFFEMLAWLILATIIFSFPANAQVAWQIDPRSSVARLSLGSGQKAVEIGLGRVSGDVVFDRSDPADAVVTLKILPEGPQGANARISFTSRGSAIRRDGKLEVTGDLSFTHVERSVTMEPNEAYTGPVYGEPVEVKETREITLVFSDRNRTLPETQGGAMQLPASASVSREDFPSFVDSLAGGAWPKMLVDDEKCATPLTSGEDYSGVACSGNVVASIPSREVATGTGGGEGYCGFQATVTPDGRQATIALDLTLQREPVGTPVADSETTASIF
jgi:polyisoprenoid-binding protein YceI